MSNLLARSSSRCLTGALAALVFTFGCSNLVHAAEIRSPEVIAVYFTADWCQQCKAIEDKLEDLGARFDGQPIVAFVMDYSDRISRHDSEMTAAVLDLEKLWQENADHLGTIYLLDAETRSVTHTIVSTDGFSSMVKKIEDALATARQ